MLLLGRLRQPLRMQRRPLLAAESHHTHNPPSCRSPSPMLLRLRRRPRILSTPARVLTQTARVFPTGRPSRRRCRCCGNLRRGLRGLLCATTSILGRIARSLHRQELEQAPIVIALPLPHRDLKPQIVLIITAAASPGSGGL